MAYEMIVGLQVTHREIYQKYREAMMPLLQKQGGGFRYDFIVGETLKSVTPEPINRVFAIYFKDREAKEAFFNDPEYLKIKEEFFEASVAARTLIADYEKN